MFFFNDKNRQEFAASPKITFLIGFLSGIASVSFVFAIIIFIAMGVKGNWKFSGVFQKEAAAEEENSKSDRNANENTNSNSQAVSNLKVADIKISKDDHAFGDPEAEVMLVEYSDFQCPFCRRFHPTIKQISEVYKGKVQWVFRHFPLESIHPQARPAAEAAECAGEQGKFFEYMDLLFENQASLNSTLYSQLAEEINLDTSKFDPCVKEGKYRAKVDADIASGKTFGVRGTPATFVNGRLISGAQSYDAVKGAVEAELGRVTSNE